MGELLVHSKALFLVLHITEVVESFMTVYALIAHAYLQTLGDLNRGLSGNKTSKFKYFRGVLPSLCHVSNT